MEPICPARTADPLPVSASAQSVPYALHGAGRALESAAAWLLAILWLLPLLYALLTAFHPAEFSARFIPSAPLTLENFVHAWHAAPFARYFLNTFVLVTLILSCQLILCTLAAYAFARFEFVGRELAFALVLLQLMIMPDVLIVENYRTMSWLGLVDTIPGIALPYVASAFFCCGRPSRAFRASSTTPRESRAPAHCRCSGGCMCRLQSRSTSPMRSCR